jgi:hypothetical protein
VVVRASGADVDGGGDCKHSRTLIIGIRESLNLNHVDEGPVFSDGPGEVLVINPTNDVHSGGQRERKPLRD